MRKKDILFDRKLETSNTIKKSRSFKTFVKIKNNISEKNRQIYLEYPENLNALICNVNKYMTKRLQTNEDEESVAWWLKSIKRYRVLISIMNAYCQNEFSTYKESIIKELRIYSYKTISNIIDDALDKKQLKYIKSKSYDEKKIKRFIPSSHLVSAYLNWNIRNISNYNKAIEKIRKQN